MKHFGLFLSSLFVVIPARPAAAETGGFIVFSSAATHNYALGPGLSLRLAATGPKMRPENSVVCGGRLFGVHPLLDKLTRYGADLKEDASVSVGPVREVTYLLGADERRLFVFFDNTLAAYDADLKPLGRVTLAAASRGQIVPVISPDGFRVFEDRVFIMASNTDDVFVVELKDLSWKRLNLDANGEAGTLRALWVDPDARTLDVLDARSSEEFVPDGKRVIKGDYTQTFPLKDLAAKPTLTRLYEEREIHERQSLDRGGDEGPEYIQHRERGPIHRAEVPPVGMNIGVMSTTNPSIAQAMEYGHETEDFPGRSLVVLRSAGRAERLESFRDETLGVDWFQRDGSTRFPHSSFESGNLQILPKEFSLVLGVEPEASRNAVLAY
ncbi:MAG: hypothetical protein HY928_12155 [Elusimicrobia bacterium]|nr:hypothetical protein [Elusimicrobiota bacterium]